jgi:hypothetical protein
MTTATALSAETAAAAASTGDSDPLAFLQKLYSALQLLNRKLVTASASGTLAAVHDIGEVLPAAKNLKIEQIPADQLAEARDLVRRIMHLQECNRSICNGGLKIIRSFAESIGQGPSYDESGNMNDALLRDLNLSA